MKTDHVDDDEMGSILTIPPCRYRCYLDETGDDRVYYCQFREYNVYYTECRGCVYGED